MRLLTVLTLALFFVSPMASAAKVYKWVDDNGKVHYSDTPRVKQQATVAVSTGSSEEAATTTKSNPEATGEHLALCKKATANMHRFLPQMERLARERMDSDPAASKKEFEKAMGELSKLQRVPASELEASCVNDYVSDDQAKTFASCFGNANDVMEASICMAFSG